MAGTVASVDWQPWSDAIFDRARAEGKPVFLSISAAWCHWCHVMDEESFTHPEVIRRLNERFIPVRVDSDKRPEINLRYNMGGWPTVAVLDAEGALVTGATYLPTGQLLTLLADHARGDAAPARTSPSAAAPAAAPLPAPGSAALDQAAAWLERTHDRTFGGFGAAPKFPQPWAIELAWRQQARTGDPKWGAMATLTLEQMRDGELYDPVDGGFFRYAASGDWSHPHYEKLLDVNAQLLSLYLRAYEQSGDASHRSTAQGTLDYLFTTLAVEGTPWFGGSQSADGDYYALPQEERLESGGPAVDRTLYVDRNAMAASALLLAARILKRPDCRDVAVKLLDHLWERGRNAGGALFHYDDGGGPAGYGLLADQAWMMTALLDQHEATGERSALERAGALASSMQALLWDPAAGGYWDLPADADASGLLRVRLKPLADNAAAALALMRLAGATGQGRWRDHAGRTLAYLATIVADYKHYAAPFGVALDQWLRPFTSGGNPA